MGVREVEACWGVSWSNCAEFHSGQVLPLTQLLHPTLPCRGFSSPCPTCRKKRPATHSNASLLTVGVCPKLAMPQVSGATSQTPAGCLQLGLCQCRKITHIPKIQDSLQSLALNKLSWQQAQPPRHPPIAGLRSGLGKAAITWAHTCAASRTQG